MRCQPTGETALYAPSPTSTSTLPRERFTRAFISVDATLVIMLSFLFAFGNGWATARRLGIDPWIAPLIQPAVDLAVVGLMIGIRYLSIHGMTAGELRMPRRWLRFFGCLTAAMNTALPLQQQHWGRAAWDTIGPILLIAWSELAPWLLRAIYSVRAAELAAQPEAPVAVCEPTPAVPELVPALSPPSDPVPAPVSPPQPPTVIDISTGTLRDTVRDFLIQWHSQGNHYEDKPAVALYSILAPVYAQQKRTLTPRWVRQVTMKEWDSLYENGSVQTPRRA